MSFHTYVARVKSGRFRCVRERASELSETTRECTLKLVTSQHFKDRQQRRRRWWQRISLQSLGRQMTYAGWPEGGPARGWNDRIVVDSLQEGEGKAISGSLRAGTGWGEDRTFPTSWNMLRGRPAC